MLSEHIDREAVIRAVTHRKVNEMLRSNITEQMIDGRNPSSWLAGFDCGMQQAIEIIGDAPTVDVAEVQHGKWISYLTPVCLSGDLYHNCSVCGDTDPWQYTTRGHAHYCPNCGAKMDGKGENDG